MKISSNVWRSGQTLLELIVSMAISSVLLTGIATSIYIAGLTAASSSAVSDTVTAAEVAVQLRDELRYTSFFHRGGKHSVDFIVVDRTGDGRADRIRYRWSGVLGDPLLRSLNDDNFKIVVTNVQDFHIEYDWKTKNEPLAPEPPAVESNEKMLMHYASSREGNQVIPKHLSGDKWWAQYFHPDDFDPSLPTNTLSWKITRVEIASRSSGEIDGEMSVQLRSATGDALPTSRVLASVDITESYLSTDRVWETIAFPVSPSLSPLDGCCLVLEHREGTVSASVAVDSNSSLGGICVSTDDGATWTSRDASSLYCKIYGKYSIPDDAEVTVQRHFLTGIRFSLQVNDSEFSRVQTGVKLLNTPELLVTSSHADFNVDPAKIDANLDGVMDWKWNSSGATASIVNSVWIAPANKPVGLRTYPDSDFNQLTTVELCCRAISQGGNGATFSMSLDRTGEGVGVITTSVVLEGDGTQSVRVFDGTATDGSLLVRVTGLNDDFVTLRIVIHPSTDRIAVWVDRVFQGSFIYAHYANHEHQCFTAWADGADVEFNSISVRESESDL